MSARVRYGQAPTIAAYCESLRSAGIKATTVVTYRKHLTAAERELGDLTQVTTKAWARYLSLMEARTARTTFLIRARTLRRFLEWAGAPIPAAMVTEWADPLPKAWAFPIDEWTVYQRATGAPRTSMTTRVRHVRRFARHAGAVGPDRVTTADLVAWIGRHDHWSPETAYSVRGSLRAFFAWAHETHLITDNPAERMPKIRRPAPRPRPLAADALHDAIGRAAGAEDERVVLMLRLAAGYGLRRGEIALVSSADVRAVEDAAGNRSWILTVHGKGRKDRRVPIDTELADRIRDAGGWLFPGQVDGHLSPMWVGKLMSRALGRDGTAHMGRHLFATTAYQATGDLLTLQALLGHASAETTRRYVDLHIDRGTAMTAAVGRTLHLTPNATTPTRTEPTELGSRHDQP